MDKRMQAKKAGRDFGALFERAMSGDFDPAAGAEGHGMRVVGLLAQEFLMGESALADAMRAFLDAISRKSDPLRRDVPPELWAALWPTMNTLLEARRSLVERKAEAEAEAGAGAGGPIAQPEPGGAGLLGDGAGPSALLDTEGRGV